MTCFLLGLKYYHIWIECFGSAESSGSGFKTLRYLGEAYLAMEDYDRATETFIAATEQSPTDSMSWVGLGEAYKKKEDHDGAIKAFELGRERNPGDLWFLKDVYMAKHDYESAIMTFHTAIEMN